MVKSMSHFIVYKTSIGNVTVELLVQAVEFASEQMGAKVFHGQIPFAFGEAQNVVVGMQTKAMRSPIGFNLDSQGNLEVCGDSWQQADEFNRVKTMATSGALTNSYIAWCKATRNRMRVKIEYQQDQVYLEAVSI